MSTRLLSIAEHSVTAVYFVLLYLTPESLRNLRAAAYALLTSSSVLRGLPKIQTTRMLKK